MTTTKLLYMERDADVLIVVPQMNVTSLAEDNVRGEFEDLLAKLQQDGVRHVVFNLRKTQYFGSSMLEAMRRVWNCVRDGGGKMALYNVSDVGREILGISKFDTLWGVAANEQAALDLVRAN